MQTFPTCSLVPSRLLHLPRIWLGEWQHMLQQIYSSKCADCPNTRVLTGQLAVPSWNKERTEFQWLCLQGNANLGCGYNQELINIKWVGTFNLWDYTSVRLRYGWITNSRDGNNWQTDGQTYDHTNLISLGSTTKIINFSLKSCNKGYEKLLYPYCMLRHISFLFTTNFLFPSSLPKIFADFSLKPVTISSMGRVAEWRDIQKHNWIWSSLWIFQYSYLVDWCHFF